MNRPDQPVDRITRPVRRPRVAVGLDRLLAADCAPLRGKRIGLLTHPAAVTADLVHALAALGRAPGVTLGAVFAPEHGMFGVQADGEHVADAHDPATGAPVFSLHGDHDRPTPAMLDGLDLIVCDLQDIGARYYTYAWTLTHMLEAAGAHGLPVFVLDRPNPIAGLAGDGIDGPILDMRLASLVGRAPIPVTHGLTLGELARMFNARWNPTPCALSVEACAGWARAMRWGETGLCFVPPSPAMPHAETAAHYPGACLIEGTPWSEGRGTALPFQIVGAPGLDAERLAEQLNRYGWPGVRFRPHHFRPSARKHAGQACAGVQAHIIDAAAYRPVRAWLGVVAHLAAEHAPLAPGFWVQFSEHPIFDRLIGDSAVRVGIEAGASLAALTESWDAAADEFRRARAPFLLYPEAL
jgi:uncharacterized protein YbbC (DUF1343 family)